MLLEVILAALILSLSIGALSVSTQGYERALLIQKERNMARLITRTQLEGCLTSGFVNLEENETGGSPHVMRFKRGVSGRRVVFLYEVEVKVKTLPDPNTKLIEVTTSYGRDKPHSFSLQLVVYQTF